MYSRIDILIESNHFSTQAPELALFTPGIHTVMTLVMGAFSCVSNTLGGRGGKSGAVCQPG